MKLNLRSDIVKIIAIVCMTIDHIGIGFLEKLYFRITDYDTLMFCSRINNLLRGIGRIAFPLFCYQLVMGFFYTKSRVKYIRNLLIFCFISEIPYDLLSYGKLFYIKEQNVMFTLLFGALMMWLFEWYKESEVYKDNLGTKKGTALYIAFIAVLLVFFAYTAVLFSTDYDAKGICYIAIIYFLKDNKTKLMELGPMLFLSAMFVVTILTTKSLRSCITYMEFAWPAILALPIMYADNGVRKISTRGKWFAYWYYPLHQLLIFLISKAVGIV